MEQIIENLKALLKKLKKEKPVSNETVLEFEQNITALKPYSHQES